MKRFKSTTNRTLELADFRPAATHFQYFSASVFAIPPPRPYYYYSYNNIKSTIKVRSTALCLPRDISRRLAPTSADSLITLNDGISQDIGESL